MRAADAAKNTAVLIEGTVKKVKGGKDLVSTTNLAFAEVATSAKKVGEIVSEIAAASNEQAEGIEQVNKAVIEMDKVVQQNAANALSGGCFEKIHRSDRATSASLTWRASCTIRKILIATQVIKLKSEQTIPLEKSNFDEF